MSSTTTLSQREALKRLRTHLGADGYMIFTVSKYFRKSAYDFVAIYKGNLRNIVWVGPRGKHIAVRPFGMLPNTAPARWTIERLKLTHDDPIRIGPQIAVSRRNLNPEHLIPPEQRKQLTLLTGYS